jgi:hypothetical protein
LSLSFGIFDILFRHASETSEDDGVASVPSG